MNTTQVDSGALDRGAPDEPDELALAADFPAVDRAAWVTRVDRVVARTGRLPDGAPAGAGVDALTSSTPDGIAVAPLYTADDVAGLPDAGVPGRAPFVRGGRARGAGPGGADGSAGAPGWDVRQWHADPDPVAVRRAVLADLAHGATSIWLAVGGAGTTVADLPAALDGVHLELAPVVLDAGGSADPDDAERAAEAYLALAAARDLDPTRLRGTLGLDPLGRHARTGTGPAPDSVVEPALRVAREFPQLRAVVVDSLPVHVAGGSAAQELGYALACGVAYLRVLVDAGLSVDAAARLLELRLAAVPDQFPTIAKLRAARRLWARVLQAGGTDAASTPAPVQHAVVSPTVYTRRDPHVNLLRGTVAGFAAGVGGADAVTVFPFDAALGAPTSFSRRIARNTQSVLVMEAHLARVTDAAGGSWYVESLTDSLARAAWAFFQELEAAGGALAALASGLVDEHVARVRAARDREPVTGVSEFPDLHDDGAARSGPDLLTVLGHRPEGLPVHRPAAAFERYRDRSDAVAAATGARPRAFLATLGPPAAHGARAAFARNLLHAGGIETVDAGATTTAAEPGEAFAAAGTPVAVLCSTDALYAERGAEAVAALRAAGARHVLLAGTTEVPGLDGHLAAGGDALAVLAAVWAVIDPHPTGPPRTSCEAAHQRADHVIDPHPTGPPRTSCEAAHQRADHVIDPHLTGQRADHVIDPHPTGPAHQRADHADPAAEEAAR